MHDRVLVEVAEILRGGVRGIDRVYRMGGEEFAVLLPGMGSAEALGVAERVRSHLASAEPAGVPLTVSAGVASAQHGSSEWREVYQRADAALLEAKKAGRNMVLPAEPEGDQGPLG